MNIMTKIKEWLKKYKVSTKKLWVVIAITGIEMILILWGNGWVFNYAMLAPLVQFIAVFKNKKGWNQLSEEEKEDLTLSEEDLENFVNKVIVECMEGKTSQEILAEIKQKIE